MNEDIRIEYDKGKLFLLSAGAIGFALFGGAMAFHIVPKIAPGSREEFFGWAGMIFFGFASVILLRRLLGPSRAVLTLTRNGFTDTRIARDEVPWGAISGIGVAKLRRQRLIVLKVDPTTEARLTLTRAARWSRGPNRALGFDGLCVSATGLKMGYDELLRAMRERHAVARGVSPPSGPTAYRPTRDDRF